MEFFCFFLQFSFCSLKQTQAPQFHNNPRKWVTPVSFKSTSESTGVMRARKDSHQRNISIASSFFTGANFSNMATKKTQKKREKKLLIRVFCKKIGIFQDLKIYIYTDTQKKYRKCSLKFPKSELIVHTGTPGAHSSNCGTKQKLHCPIVSALQAEPTNRLFVRIVRKVQAKESPNFSKAKNLMQIEIPRHSPCTYYTYLL